MTTNIQHSALAGAGGSQRMSDTQWAGPVEPKDTPTGYDNWMWRDWPGISCLVRNHPLTPIAEVFPNGAVRIQTMRTFTTEDFAALSRIVLAKLQELQDAKEPPHDNP